MPVRVIDTIEPRLGGTYPVVARANVGGDLVYTVAYDQDTGVLTVTGNTGNGGTIELVNIIRDRTAIFRPDTDGTRPTVTEAMWTAGAVLIERSGVSQAERHTTETPQGSWARYTATNFYEARDQYGFPANAPNLSRGFTTYHKEFWLKSAAGLWVPSSAPPGHRYLGDFNSENLATAAAIEDDDLAYFAGHVRVLSGFAAAGTYVYGWAALVPLPHELSEDEAQGATSDVFGQVSGRRLAQALSTVGTGKADTNLQNILDSLTPAQQKVVVARIGADLSGYGHPPQAGVDYEGRHYTNLITGVESVCVNRPIPVTASTGTFEDIDRDDFEYTESVERSDGTIDLLRPPVLGEWLYDEHFETFYNGVNVGGGRVEWLSDTADDALAGSLANQGNTALFYGPAETDAEILAQLHTLPANSEVFYFNGRMRVIRRLIGNTYVAAGSVVDHYLWEPVKADPRVEDPTFDQELDEVRDTVPIAGDEFLIRTRTERYRGIQRDAARDLTTIRASTQEWGTLGSTPRYMYAGHGNAVFHRYLLANNGRTHDADGLAATMESARQTLGSPNSRFGLAIDGDHFYFGFRSGQGSHIIRWLIGDEDNTRGIAQADADEIIGTALLGTPSAIYDLAVKTVADDEVTGLDAGTYIAVTESDPQERDNVRVFRSTGGAFGLWKTIALGTAIPNTSVHPFGITFQIVRDVLIAYVVIPQGANNADTAAGYNIIALNIDSGLQIADAELTGLVRTTAGGAHTDVKGIEVATVGGEDYLFVGGNDVAGVLAYRTYEYFPEGTVVRGVWSGRPAYAFGADVYRANEALNGSNRVTSSDLSEGNVLRNVSGKKLRLTGAKVWVSPTVAGTFRVEATKDLTEGVVNWEHPVVATPPFSGDAASVAAQTGDDAVAVQATLANALEVDDGEEFLVVVHRTDSADAHAQALRHGQPGNNVFEHDFFDGSIEFVRGQRYTTGFYESGVGINGSDRAYRMELAYVLLTELADQRQALPQGGAEGTALVKRSLSDYDVEFRSIPRVSGIIRTGRNLVLARTDEARNLTAALFPDFAGHAGQPLRVNAGETDVDFGVIMQAQVEGSALVGNHSEVVLWQYGATEPSAPPLPWNVTDQTYLADLGSWHATEAAALAARAATSDALWVAYGGTDNVSGGGISNRAWSVFAVAAHQYSGDRGATNHPTRQASDNAYRFLRPDGTWSPWLHLADNPYGFLGLLFAIEAYATPSIDSRYSGLPAPGFDATHFPEMSIRIRAFGDYTSGDAPDEFGAEDTVILHRRGIDWSEYTNVTNDRETQAESTVKLRLDDVLGASAAWYGGDATNDALSANIHSGVSGQPERRMSFNMNIIVAAADNNRIQGVSFHHFPDNWAKTIVDIGLR